MREQLEGSQGIARAVARCRPEVVSAYPITPQTHIVEALSRMVRSGDAVLKPGADGEPYAFDLDFCKGCGICAHECPCGAIEMIPEAT
jgi:Pyruvate/2-oxoacid:ferredoxin oxidoreductase delta subunit